MKILVLQIQIGDGNFGEIIKESEQHVKYNFSLFEQKYCLPSIKKWAEKYGYDYKLITESVIPDNDDFFISDRRKYAFERLMYFDNEEYDYIIYFDTDIIIKNNAPEFPIKPGISMCKEYLVEEDNHFLENVTYKRTNKFLENIKREYYNSGVICIDTKTGKELKNIFLNRLKENDTYDLSVVDQDLINKWLIENNYTMLNILDERWNYFTMYEYPFIEYDRLELDEFCKMTKEHIKNNNNTKIKESFAIHFLGTAKLFHLDFIKRGFN